MSLLQTEPICKDSIIVYCILWLLDSLSISQSVERPNKLRYPKHGKLQKLDEMLMLTLSIDYRYFY